MSDITVKRSTFQRFELGAAKITEMPRSEGDPEPPLYVLGLDANPMTRAALVELRDLVTLVLEALPPETVHVPVTLDPKGGVA